MKDVCEPSSLAEFGWALFGLWQAAGSPSRESWVLGALGLIGDDETVRRLTPVIRAWPGEGGHARAVAGLDVLTTIGSDVALMHLHGIAQKVRFRGLRERAKQKVDEVAAALGLRPEQLADRLVPDLGLDPGGSLALDYGPRQFTVGFDERLKPYVADQIRRLEHAMVAQRRWTVADFTRFFVAHPLLTHLVRRLVLASYGADGAAVGTLRVAEDRTFADVNDDPVTLPEAGTVGIAHPLHLAGGIPAWGRIFADYEIIQPFPQLGRDVHTLTEQERSATRLTRFEGATVHVSKVLGLERRGWQRGAPQDAGVQCWIERALPDGRYVVVALDPGIAVGLVNEFPDQQLREIWVRRSDRGSWRSEDAVPLGDLDLIATSEIIRDLQEVTA